MTHGARLSSRLLPVFIVVHAALVFGLLYLYSKLEDVPAIYLAAGVLWAGLMLLPARAGAILAGAAFCSQLAAEVLVYQSLWPVALIYAGSKTLEAVAGVWLVRHVIKVDVLRSRLFDVAVFIGIACFAMPIVFAVPPELARELFLDGTRADLYFHWTVLQAIGVAVGAPLIIYWLHGEPPRVNGRGVEMLALAAFLAVVFGFVFLIEPRFLEFNSMLYLTFPPLIWAATRFGCRGATLANFVLACIAVSAALLIGLTSFGPPELRLSVIAVELFIGVTALITLVLAAYAEERERAILTQRYHRERLSELSLRLVEHEEQFRQRIATQLHDDLGQMLAVSKLRLKLAERTPAMQPALADELSSVAASIDDAIDTTRRLTRETASSLYQHGHLGDAIRGHLDNICAGLNVEHHLDCDVLPALDAATSRVLSRCVRECVINVVKHAQASRVHVRLQSRGDHLSIDITDDGVGFDVDTLDAPSGREASFGLFSVENALLSLGGSLRIHSGTDGTTVSLVVPIRAAVVPA